MAGGRLTTHVLDTAHGTPAADLRIELLAGHGAGGDVLKAVRTNSDGRCDEPLLQGQALEVGHYELRFHVGEYFRPRSIDCFYDVVPVPFVVTDAAVHYHVPLLVSPFGYSTYRGS